MRDKDLLGAGLCFSAVPLIMTGLTSAAMMIFGKEGFSSFISLWAINIFVHVFAVLIPLVIIVNTFNLSLLRDLREKISFRNCALGFFAVVFAIPVVNQIHYFMLVLINTFFGRIDEAVVSQGGAAGNRIELFTAVFLIVVYPSISEELLFRGLIQTAFMKRFRPFYSILLTGFLFGLFHMSFELFTGTFLLGLVIGTVAYKAKSIYPAVAAHFANNLLAVLVGFIFRNSGTESIPVFSQYIEKIVLHPDVSIFGGLIFGGLIWAVWRLLNMIKPPKDSCAGGGVAPAGIKVKRSRADYAAFLPGVLIILFLYLHEAFRLLS